MENNKKVFISYAWTVQKRVIELAERLISNGIDVVLDVYDLKEGQDKYAFMEKSVNDSSIDRVLIICDKSYTEKANTRQGGVGDETAIISPEIYEQIDQEKFIPVIFEHDEDGKAYCPQYIKSRIYIDLSDDNADYEKEYEKLLRNIYDKPIYKKPALGTKPEWIENETVNLAPIRDIIKQIRGYLGDNPNKADFLVRKAADEFVKAAEQYVLPDDKPVEDSLLSVIDSTKPYRDLFVDYCEALLFSPIPINDILANLFETLYNNLHDISNKTYNEAGIELYDFMIQELFISTTALLLHYEKYIELNSLLTHTYFLRINYYTNNFEARPYFVFRRYLNYIEGECKKKAGKSNLISFTGEILINRERKPILTQNTISNADIFLYQFGCTLNATDFEYEHWYPETYVYHRSVQIMWKKLKSVDYCNKIKVLFGANTVDELKEIISNPNNEIKNIKKILDNIRYDEIGTMK